MCVSLPPPVTPILVIFASPGPLTTQPIIDTVIGVDISSNFFLIFLQFQ